MPLTPEILSENSERQGKDSYQRYQKLGGQVNKEEFDLAVKLIESPSRRRALIDQKDRFEKKSFDVDVGQAYSLGKDVEITKEMACIFALLFEVPVNRDRGREKSFSQMWGQEQLIETFLLILAVGHHQDEVIARQNLRILLSGQVSFPPRIKEEREIILSSL